MGVRVDWKNAADHMLAEHSITPLVADEVVNDPDAVWLDPDPASLSGRSVRVIGYSSTARCVGVAILVRPDPDADGDTPVGQWWGANSWRANAADERRYRSENEHDIAHEFRTNSETREEGNR